MNLEKIIINEHVHLEKFIDSNTYIIFFDNIKFGITTDYPSTVIENLDVKIPIFKCAHSDLVNNTFPTNVYYKNNNLCIKIDDKIAIVDLLNNSYYYLDIKQYIINAMNAYPYIVSNKIVIDTTTNSKVIFDIQTKKIIKEYIDTLGISLFNDYYAVNYINDVIIYDYNNNVLNKIGCNVAPSTSKTKYSKLLIIDRLYGLEQFLLHMFIYCKFKNDFIPILAGYIEYKNGYFILNKNEEYKLRNNLYKISSI